MMSSTSDVCALREWDSAFFGYQLAQVNGGRMDAARAAAIDAWCECHQVDGLYFLADDDPQSIHTAERYGYHWMDTRILYDRNLARFPAPMPALPDGLSWRLASTEDAETLKALALDAYPYSRFAVDPHFAPERNNHLYQAWVEKSISGTFDDGVIVLEYEGAVVAFMSFGLDETQKAGNLRLMSTHPDYRGGNLQLGTNMVETTVAYLAERQMQRIDVVAQLRNIAAQRIFQHLGFRLRSVRQWYHKWYR